MVQKNRMRNDSNGHIAENALFPSILLFYQAIIIVISSPDLPTTLELSMMIGDTKGHILNCLNLFLAVIFKIAITKLH